MDIHDIVSNNQVFQGGLILGMIGGIIASLRSVPNKFIRLFKRYFVINIEVYNSDVLFYYIAQWVASDAGRNKSNILRAYLNEPDSISTKNNEDKNVKAKNSVEFTSGVGVHWLKHKKRNILIQRIKEESTQTLVPKEYFYLTTFSWNKKFIQELLQDIINEYMKEDGLSIHSWNGHYWGKRNGFYKRNLETVVIRKDIKKEIVDDIDKFLNNKSVYISRGVPWRRGYLFYGLPGTGKSSLINAIASKYDMSVFIVNLTDLTDASIIEAFSNTYQNSLIVIEDIDTFLNNRETKNTKVTYSGLLNAIDGVASVSGRILVVTTNKPNCLDDSFLRNGRIDRKWEIGYITSDEIKEFFLRFYPNEMTKASSFAAMFKQPLAPHKLQNHFMKYENVDDTLTNWKDLLQEEKPCLDIMDKA